ncbi:BZ3500_MvSof-1268-A1-R1_Chr5-1g07612 [Microbotryum saponariae]|uniref:BZ3500_MvSof-1268-A1-R1_Chr5-1g07612 protein n=1 Tax=Microbotryum saponariae TaxID=289078 RepID=A0A2X0M0X3_9BASI|nr:BZ3500_MvSof-1268-A1-R1_Chr5-1g07612 [Microbotryum saponariae]SDA05483.1 BZ3501_MvSof-1269-A2-R1_Chr5-2g07436 [Microbotryum saponariae]
MEKEAFISWLRRPLATTFEVTAVAHAYQFQVSLASRFKGITIATAGHPILQAPASPAFVAQSEAQGGSQRKKPHKRGHMKGPRNAHGSRRPPGSTCHLWWQRSLVRQFGLSSAQFIRLAKCQE